MTHEDLSMVADILGILSFFIALAAFCIAIQITKKLKHFKIMDSYVNGLEKINADLSTSKYNSLIPSSKQQHILEILKQIKNYHTRKNLKIPEEINDCIDLIDSNPNCSKGGVISLIRTIIINIQISPELIYALK